MKKELKALLYGILSVIGGAVTVYLNVGYLYDPEDYRLFADGLEYGLGFKLPSAIPNMISSFQSFFGKIGYYPIPEDSYWVLLPPLLVLGISFLVLIFFNDILFDDDLDATPVSVFGAVLCLLGSLATFAGGLYVCGAIVSCILPLVTIIYPAAFLVWLCYVLFALHGYFEKFIQHKAVGAEAERDYQLYERQERLQREMERQQLLYSDIDEDKYSDGGSDDSWSGGGSSLAQMPFLVYDSSNRPWKRRGIYGDHAEYYNDDGDTATVYSADISGDSASTNVGNLHWY